MGNNCLPIGKYPYPQREYHPSEYHPKTYNVRYFKEEKDEPYFWRSQYLNSNLVPPTLSKKNTKKY